MFKKSSLLISTIQYLKPIQLKYQLLYRLKKPKRLTEYKKQYRSGREQYLSFIKRPPVYQSYLGKNRFCFLNIPHDFREDINWNLQKYGKLWNYNLQYANYILQEEISIAEKIHLLQSIYAALASEKLPLEPYPVSLRAINVIRFFCENKIDEPGILENVNGELTFLSERPEYHLLGNHLLENGFALIMGGAFFSNKKWLSQGEKILSNQLNEQILKDGAHFELSPMYHQIILFRLLELIDWYGKYPLHNRRFFQLIVEKAELMCVWLENISFANGDIPHFNDSADGIAYSTEWLLSYAEELDLHWKNIPLGESGYRCFNTDIYECRVDFAQIGPSYQPGHAHADALSFILYYNNRPLFVEQGTSTYEIGPRRNLERSTAAHNSVVINNTNQSQIWSGFRVGRRAKTFTTEDNENFIEAFHDGYKNMGIKHRRSFRFEDDQIIIEDILSKVADGVFYLHLHPNSDVIKESPTTFAIDSKITLEFVHSKDAYTEEYLFSHGYNTYLKAQRIVVPFDKALKTTILFN